MTEPQRDELTQRLDRLERELRQSKRENGWWKMLSCAAGGALILVLLVEDCRKASNIITALDILIPYLLYVGIGICGLCLLVIFLIIVCGAIDGWRTGEAWPPLSAVNRPGERSLRDFLLIYLFFAVVMGAILLFLDSPGRTIIGLVVLGNFAYIVFVEFTEGLTAPGEPGYVPPRLRTPETPASGMQRPPGTPRGPFVAGTTLSAAWPYIKVGAIMVLVFALLGLAARLK